MSLDELFTEESQDGEPVTRPMRRRGPSTQRAPSAAEDTGGHVQRAGSRKAVELESGVRWERLTPSSDPSADFLFVVYDVGGSSSQGDQFIRHWGREYGLVLSGTLEVTVGFDSYLLGPGDSISFDSTVPHRLRNTGREPATGVWLVSGRQSDSRTLAFDEDDGKPVSS